VLEGAGCPGSPVKLTVVTGGIRSARTRHNAAERPEVNAGMPVFRGLINRCVAYQRFVNAPLLPISMFWWLFWCCIFLWLIHRRRQSSFTATMTGVNERMSAIVVIETRAGIHHDHPLDIFTNRRKPPQDLEMFVQCKTVPQPP